MARASGRPFFGPVGLEEGFGRRRQTARDAQQHLQGGAEARVSDVGKANRCIAMNLFHAGLILTRKNFFALAICAYLPNSKKHYTRRTNPMP